MNEWESDWEIIDLSNGHREHRVDLWTEEQVIRQIHGLIETGWRLIYVSPTRIAWKSASLDMGREYTWQFRRRL